MFLPEFWPAYYEKAKGTSVWDLDGNRYTDLSIMGIGSCVLGYANPSVNVAVKKSIGLGTMSTLNCHEEVSLAEKLIALHPWAGMARFARTGGEACAIAVRISRAFSGKDKIFFCGYHGWTDWYLASNLTGTENLSKLLLPGLAPNGVPKALAQTAIPFHYGVLDELKAKVAAHKGRIGTIIMEVQRHKPVDVAFLKAVRAIASKIQAVLIFDEITSGFRARCGGCHMLYGVEPDIVVLGKAMGNGYPIASVIGRKDVMQAAQETFISSTYWTERIGFVAALEVIRQFQKKQVPKHLERIGRELITGLRSIFASYDLKIEVEGTNANPILVIHEQDPLVVKTVFTQEMLKRGFLASTTIYLSLAHTSRTIRCYLAQAAEVFALISKAIKKNELQRLLQGPVCHSGFQRLA
ncbi:MAG: aminotransferase class III-fold pyridoxal phosphate-dependent enzyme [Candidatus Omnitrophota bacterium]